MLNKSFFLIFFLFAVLPLLAQQNPYQLKKIPITTDTIAIDSLSIAPYFFKITNQNNQPIDTTFYKINFGKAQIIIKNKLLNNDTLTVRYLKYPDFITKSYAIYSKNKVVNTLNSTDKRYTITKQSIFNNNPLQGLTTTGSITRGIAVGNNQNASLNSNLDLQITGNLSNNVHIRASIQDSNIPMQEGGYSQKINQFDQVFLELFSDNWSVRGGDIFLENKKSRLLNFNKKVLGVLAQVALKNNQQNTDILASGAIVRGQYAKSTFVGQEGNQGPYKLKGPNGELYVLVVAGSEKVFVNGTLLNRGENNQYLIDYNAGEITFTTLYPITSEMRISIEYQYTDRSYTRYITYTGVNHEQKKWSLAGYIYAESDIKNQPLQQSLSEQQIQSLTNAGDSNNQMYTESAVLDTYSVNKILYKKVQTPESNYFEYTTNPNDILYTVKFSLVGNNKGNYIIKNNNTNGKIYQYIAPIAGILQGNYQPIQPLVAPTKLQVATVMGRFLPFNKTQLAFELAISNNDKNLFSDKDDTDNQGLAGNLHYNQQIGKRINWFANWQFVQQNFKPIERLYAIEFTRDWNLNQPTTSNQSLFTTQISYTKNSTYFCKYQYDNLLFGSSFLGNKHQVQANYTTNNVGIITNNSCMYANNSKSESVFLRSRTQAGFYYKKKWLRTTIGLENNQEKTIDQQKLLPNSQKFIETGYYIGKGDSTKIFVEIGYLNRKNDSLLNQKLALVNTSHAYQLKTTILQSTQRNLSLYAKYRTLEFTTNQPKQTTLSSRLQYNDSFFKQGAQTSCMLETTSGTMPQQEFNFIAVDAGRGIYAWNDYNNNGIQEIQEFEIAKYPDQAKYLKLFLPNQIYIKTHQNKYLQSITINPIQWKDKSKIQDIIAHFYNQTTALIEQKAKNNQYTINNFLFQPNPDQVIGLTTNFKNTLFFNRGKQYHSVNYCYTTNHLKSYLISGNQQAINSMHEIQYTHLVQKTWLLSLQTQNKKDAVYAENYLSRNFKITTFLIQPKLSYFITPNNSVDFFYQYQNKHNTIGDLEHLTQNKLGLNFNLTEIKKISISGSIAYLYNQYNGNEFSPVGFQILEGLQPQKNITWQLLVQKNITKYLDLNLNYQARTSSNISTIHTGNIQIRANF